MERYIPVAQTRLKGTARLVIVLVNKDTKERYWGQQFCQMERDISVRPTEMTRPVKEDKTEMFRAILCINRRTKPKCSVPFYVSTKISGIFGWMESALCFALPAKVLLHLVNRKKSLISG